MELRYPQTFFEGACYALQLLHFAHGALDDIVSAVEKGYIQEDGYVNNPEAFLYMITHKHYHIRKEGASYKARAGEYIINFYAKNQINADKGIGHFDTPAYHTLEHSVTIAVGRIFSKRVITYAG